MNLFNPVSRQFNTELKQYFHSQESDEPGLWWDPESLPKPLIRYLEYTGFLHRAPYSNAEVIWNNSAIKLKPGGSWTGLKTKQYNAAKQPSRICLMKGYFSKLVPFEVRDIYAAGKGHMLGKAGRLYRFLNEDGSAVSQSALGVILSESLLIPGYINANYMEWKELDQYSVKGTLRDAGYTLSGIFSFNKEGAWTQFETDDRYYGSGKEAMKVPFRAVISRYLEQDGLKLPGGVTAIWYPEGNPYEYWKGEIKRIAFKY